MELIKKSFLGWKNKKGESKPPVVPRSPSLQNYRIFGQSPSVVRATKSTDPHDVLSQCTSCTSVFDTTNKRRLIDSCGHERCYTCVFSNKICLTCNSSCKFSYTHQNLTKPDTISSSFQNTKTSLLNRHFSSRTFHSQPGSPALAHCSSKYNNKAHKVNSTPPVPRRSRFNSQSPKPNRPSWLQRHGRPTDEPPFSDDNSSSTRTSIRSKNCDYSSPFERSSSLGGYGRGVSNGQLGIESGFQSYSSLTSVLGKSKASPSESLLSLTSSCLEPPIPTSSSYSRYSESREISPSHSSEILQYCSKLQDHWRLKRMVFEIPKRNSKIEFVGREWIFNEIFECITSDLPTNKGVTILGAPGTGKTFIIQKLVENSCFKVTNGDSHYIELDSQKSTGFLSELSSMVVAHHFCQIENKNTCSVHQFVHSLAAQLSSSLPSYHRYLMVHSDIYAKLSPGEVLANPDESFTQGILEPLRVIQSDLLATMSKRPLLLLIDGLDEGESHSSDYEDTIRSFLAKHIIEFPSWLKLLCTLRSNDLNLCRNFPFHQINLDKFDVDERVKKDILDYILLRINASSSLLTNIIHPSSKSKDEIPHLQKFTNILMNLSRGCFLFVSLTLDLIERGALVSKSSAFKLLPHSLSEIYLLEFNLKFPSFQSYSTVSDIFSICLASPFPLTHEDIYKALLCLGIYSQFPWKEFLRSFTRLSEYLVSRQDGTLMFIHSSFRDWLLSRSSGTRKFLCDPQIGHVALCLYFLSSERSSNESSSYSYFPYSYLDYSSTTIFSIAHHLLKSQFHVSKNVNLHSIWRQSVSEESLSKALSSLTNIYIPNIQISKLLLASGASSSTLVSNYFGQTPILGVMAHEGFEEMVNLLLEFGAEVNEKNSLGLSPLMFASMRGHIRVVRTLISYGSTVNAIDSSHKCALVHAAHFGALDVVETLIASEWKSENDLNLDEAAQQALVLAAYRGKIDIVEYLLDMAEVNVNGHETLRGESALYAASISGQRDVCALLLKRGASSTTPNLAGIPPLHMAVKQGHWSVTDLLLKEGKAYVEQIDPKGKTPLMIAANEGHSGLCELLLGSGAELNNRDKDGRSALSHAALKAHYEIVDFLLRQGADVESKDNEGQSPLFLACQRGSTEIVNLLLESGANMDQMNNRGLRPLDVAISSSQVSVVRCFLKRGVRLSSTTWSLAHHQHEILLLLLNKLLEDGNTFFRKGQYEEGSHRYRYALRRLPTNSHILNEKLKKTFLILQTHLLLNLTRCKRKNGQLSEAIALADKAIQIQPLSYEAHYAKAKANREAGNLEDALLNLTEAIRISPSHRDLHRSILRLKEELRLQRNLASKDESTKDGCDESTSGVESSSGSPKDFETSSK